MACSDIWEYVGQHAPLSYTPTLAGTKSNQLTCESTWQQRLSGQTRLGMPLCLKLSFLSACFLKHRPAGRHRILQGCGPSPNLVRVRIWAGSRGGMGDDMGSAMAGHVCSSLPFVCKWAPHVSMAPGTTLEARARVHWPKRPGAPMLPVRVCA
jgi:hypothetical protein